MSLAGESGHLLSVGMTTGLRNEEGEEGAAHALPRVWPWGPALPVGLYKPLTRDPTNAQRPLSREEAGLKKLGLEPISPDPKPVPSPPAQPSPSLRAAAPNLFGTRDRFCGTVFPQTGGSR